MDVEAHVEVISLFYLNCFKAILMVYELKGEHEDDA